MKLPTRLGFALLYTLLDLLASELGQTLDNIGPSLVFIDEGLDSLQNLILAGTNLLGRVAVAQGDGVVLDGLEVDGDTEGSAQLVVTGVTLANAGRRVIHTAGNTQTAQLHAQVLGQGLEGGVGGERHQQDLGRGDGWGEGEDL